VGRHSTRILVDAHGVQAAKIFRRSCFTSNVDSMIVLRAKHGTTGSKYVTFRGGLRRIIPFAPYWSAACRRKKDPPVGGGGRSHQGKILVVGAVEVQDGGAGPGRIRLQPVSDYSAASLHLFLAANLAPAATAKTDGWSGYPGAPGVHHDPHTVGTMAAHIVLPWTHCVFSNLKTWALGVYHGLRREHLQSYLDEFVFRFNRRHQRHASFRSLLGIAAGHAPLTYKMLVSPEATA
jgi:ISXO2-like transposase domain